MTHHVEMLHYSSRKISFQLYGNFYQLIEVIGTDPKHLKDPRKCSVEVLNKRVEVDGH